MCHTHNLYDALLQLQGDQEAAALLRAVAATFRKFQVPVHKQNMVGDVLLRVVIHHEQAPLNREWDWSQLVTHLSRLFQEGFRSGATILKLANS